jgi:excisionase family DNA binding protein
MKRRRDAAHCLAAIDQLITSLTDTVRTSGDPENMGISEAATYLRISESKLYKMTSAREIPHSKVGRQLRFKKSELDEFLENEKMRVAGISRSEKAEAYIANYPLKKKKRTNTH